MGSFVENVNQVAKVLPSDITEIQLLIDNIVDINTVASNIDEVIVASDNAAVATQKALEASNSATAADLSADSASADAIIATTKAAEALASETLASSKATIATTQAGIAITKASEASTSASNALASEVNASASATAAQGYASSINPSTLVHNTGDETVAGIKTFTSSPIAPTPTQGDSSTKLATTQWVQTNAVGAKGGGTDKVFFENDQAVTTDYTITAGKNAMSAGMITINNGVTVTVPSGSTWVVV